MENDLKQPVTSPSDGSPLAPVAVAAEPASSNDDNVHGSASVPLHTQTQSTLAPTSEYVRYLLLALPARYIPRGIFGTLFETKHFDGNALSRGLAKLVGWFQTKLGIRTTQQPRPAAALAAEHASAFAYNTVMGVGSLALTASYSWTVYKDIKNIFSEAVAAETGKSPEAITFKDLQKSDNRIVQKTMDNFWQRFIKRAITDVLFFPAAIARSTTLGDLMVGIKALQAFAETWKRKTTLFEDLIGFINNKINPRNGLGQPITVGEIFDLYQHYAEAFQPDRMFHNVVGHGANEGARWAHSQPIFTRITELMNETYAYKHQAVIDPKTGLAIHQADFALPKFIYLLGHDLIDITQPEKTLATIEIANRYGIAEVKTMQAMLKQGVALEAVMKRYPVPQPPPREKTAEEGKNTVIAKGSTMQPDVAGITPEHAANDGQNGHPHGGKIPLSSVHRPTAHLPHPTDHANRNIPGATTQQRHHDGTITSLHTPQLTA